MPLPQITGANPIVTPAVEMKNFPDSYIMALHMQAIPGDRQTFNVRLRPYSYERKELYDRSDADVSMTIDDIWVEAARSTTFAALMGSICQVTSWIIRERQLLAIAEPTAEEQAELATIKEYLGVTK